MDHSLINPNQIRANDIDMSNNPFDKDKDFGIDHAECFIPFRTAGSTVFFESFVPSDEQLNSLRCIELTDSEEWDPSGVQLNKYELNSRERFIRQVTRYDTRDEYETDNILASVSDAFCPSLFAEHLVRSVNVVSKQDFEALCQRSHVQRASLEDPPGTRIKSLWHWIERSKDNFSSDNPEGCETRNPPPKPTVPSGPSRFASKPIERAMVLGPFDS
jgi:hypothetical protein